MTMIDTEAGALPFSEQILGRYSDGECMFLTLALNEYLGLPCMIFYATDGEKEGLHCANVWHGGYLDVYGKQTLKNIINRYGRFKPVVISDCGRIFLEFKGEIADRIAERGASSHQVLVDAAWQHCGQFLLETMACPAVKPSMRRKMEE